MKKAIKNVELYSRAKDNIRLKVEIPAGMTGKKLLEWKRKNQKEIEEFAE